MTEVVPTFNELRRVDEPTVATDEGARRGEGRLNARHDNELRVRRLRACVRALMQKVLLKGVTAFGGTLVYPPPYVGYMPGHYSGAMGWARCVLISFTELVSRPYGVDPRIPTMPGRIM